MNILVLNSGSSSIKYQFFQFPSTEPVCTGLVERIGLENSIITHKINVSGTEKVIKTEGFIANHEQGMLEVGKLLTRADIAVLQDPSELEVVGHRIVQGGETLTKTTIITPEVKAEIKRLFPLAPLHNPGHYKGIEVSEQMFKKAVQVAVFDTSFHQTLPAKAYRYAVPENFYKDLGIRVYGFHGTSHKYVSERAMEYLNNPNARLITIHLGNGCSMAAVKAGVCLDTSMGLTPLDGLVMGTRCGNIDPSVLLYLIEQEGYTSEQLSNLLTKQSGMVGLTGHSDMRDIRKMIEEGNANAKLAYEIYAYRIKKFIGSYTAALNGLDAIIFTAGVGENDALVREMACRDMSYFGIEIDLAKNSERVPGIREINAEDAKTKILVVPTNEELEIANQCYALLKA
ncbi:acetate kinase [Mucilaginibacter sp. BJC16-A38]|uniref:acetate/propionate family kinase n=1 Tax=Mucilaginibacter phenanthrenivorans TaxID=1234842 RepID=UPI0021586CDC|nr:acetate kinase [Mucilaginibacter phenanthrenivorans]MCR8556315.1 acetate kinase [Mucilaginibacter phenanthrenivorans]